MLAVLAAAATGLLHLSAAGAATSASVVAVVEAERLSLPSAAGQAFGDASASAGARLLIWSNGTASGTTTSSAPATALVVRAQGRPVRRCPADACARRRGPGRHRPGRCHRVDRLHLARRLGRGAHAVQVSFTNDHGAAGCDRNLTVDRIQLGARTCSDADAGSHADAHAAVHAAAHVDADADALAHERQPVRRCAGLPRPGFRGATGR